MKTKINTKMRTKRYVRYGLVLLFIVSMGFYIRSDDQELFLGKSSVNQVKPNVMILMDSSGSMNNVIFYPRLGIDGVAGTSDDGFDPKIAYTGTVQGFSFSGGGSSSTQSITSTGWYARWVVGTQAREYQATDTGRTNLTNAGGRYVACTGGAGNIVQVTSSSQTNYNNFAVGDTLLYQPGNNPRNYGAVAKIKSKGTWPASWFELENVKGGTIEANGNFQKAPTGQGWIARVIQLYGNIDHGNNTRYMENYMKWMYIAATDAHRDAITHFSTYGTFDVTKTPSLTENSNCYTDTTRYKKVFTRMQTAREVICKIVNDSYNSVKLGLFEFTNDEGAVKVKDLQDITKVTDGLETFKNDTYDVFAHTWTPLAESLADIWKYFKPGTAKTYWPSDYEIARGWGGHSHDAATTKATTPIEYWCQTNYVIIMTDGESTMDRFDTNYANSIFKQKPCHRTEPWTSWDDGWGNTDYMEASTTGIPIGYNSATSTYCPNWSCWNQDDHGTDYLDDVAYFMRHQDLFPDSFYGTDTVTGWPGNQTIFTYTIGLNADNDMLRNTAIMGDGGFYTATNYEELTNAFQLVITSINLRNFGFSAITAPKKTATATNEDLTMSYVGYFMPSLAKSIWEGHLLAFQLYDAWGFDTDSNGAVDPHEFVYSTEEACLNASGGLACQRSVYLAAGHQWDAADHIPATRSLYTHNNSSTLIDFDSAHAATLQPLFGAAVTATDAEKIITKIREPVFADVYHSDVTYVGAPPYGKQFLTNLKPPNTGDQTYGEFYNLHKNRRNALYVGTNDGILHMLYADYLQAGTEVWGFIPDTVLPSLKTIVLDEKFTYTVDGRLSANDIYYKKGGDSNNSWSTILVFGLRMGGNVYYALDISDTGSQPQPLWKFVENTYSGQSWGKPSIGRIKYTDPATGVTGDKWVAVMPGGFAFNSENPTSKLGKALFVVDASNGDLLWMIGYDSLNGAADVVNSTEVVDVTSSDQTRYLTKSDYFNFPIPSAVTAIDVDNNGYLDTVYFGNLGGHMFKTDISNPDKSKWATYKIYKTDITNKAFATISSIDTTTLTLTVSNSDNFAVGDTVQGLTSYAVVNITNVTTAIPYTITVKMDDGTFLATENIAVRTYDPIYLAPALAIDPCYQLWVGFGTGNRDRPRSDTKKGRFYCFVDNNSFYSTADLAFLSWGSTAGSALESVTFTQNGFYFDFKNAGEKLFDPEPLILPDDKLVPHIYFNTYMPPSSSVTTTNPCDVPKEGTMTVYDISITCGISAEGNEGTTAEGSRSTGRIAGGGVYQGKEYVLYSSDTGKVGDVPGSEGGNFRADPKRLPYPGGVVFYKEKKR